MHNNHQIFFQIVLFRANLKAEASKEVIGMHKESPRMSSAMCNRNRQSSTVVNEIQSKMQSAFDFIAQA